ncbi:MAG: sulfatase-like hydrolase/transferase, partial [Verrucomicrobiota bacterium]
MKSKHLFLSLAALILSGQIMASEKPNILLFLMDDMGYSDCRVYNPDSKVAMPHLEKMARDGLVFTDAHSPSAVCAPTRYSVLTGNYPWRGRNENGTWLFHMASQVMPGQKTMGQLMQSAGYETAFLGKVHLGGTVLSRKTGKPKRWLEGGHQDFDFSKPIQDTPASFGFDYAYELPQGIQGPPYLAFENGMLVGKPEELKIWEKGTYGKSVIDVTGFGSPDWDSSQAGPILTEKALGFLDQRSKDKPFFLYYASQSCHVPHSPPETLNGQQVAGAAADTHLDMLVEADLTLGAMISALEKSGDLDNTLIIFTSDNGGLSRGRMTPRGPEGGHDSCAGLRGSKALIFEGGHRVPFIARWGKEIKAGTETGALVGLQDLHATAAEMSGQTMQSAEGLD